MNHYDEIDHDEHTEQARQQAEERAAETAYSAAVAKAAKIGREHGENAATWIEYDGPAECERTLEALAAGDPAVYDYLPTPDLSGEWADGYTPRRLLEDVGLFGELDEDGYDAGELCDAYETAFSEAVEEAVTAACREAIR